MDNYSAIKRNSVLTHYNMDEPGTYLPSARNQTQDSTYHMIPFYEMFRIGKPIETEIMVARGWGK